MKKVLLIIAFITTITSANDISLLDIKTLIEQNGKTIEQNREVIEQNGKKIELMEVKLELTKKEIDKRFDFLQNIIYLVLAAVFGVPLYLDTRRSKNDEELAKTKDKIKEITLVFKELAQHDPKIKRSIDMVGLWYINKEIFMPWYKSHGFFIFIFRLI